MFVSSREESREVFLRVRAKMGSEAALEPLEQLIAEVIDAHPEFHAALDQGDRAYEAEYAAGQLQPNPFLHMGLHIALIEQLQTDRPAGIRAIYQQLLLRTGNQHHAVEHRMMDCLADALWSAGQAGRAPDEHAYLAALRALL